MRGISDRSKSPRRVSKLNVNIKYRWSNQSINQTKVLNERTRVGTAFVLCYSTLTPLFGNIPEAAPFKGGTSPHSHSEKVKCMQRIHNDDIYK